jgi:Fur family ferric uptake transcriptional regulator
LTPVFRPARLRWVKSGPNDAGWLARTASSAAQGPKEALARFEEFLAPRGLRLTGARRAIVEAIFERPGHFEIEELIQTLRVRGIRGSRATVYRIVPLLTEAGLIQQAVVTAELRSYERSLGREHHDHLVCSRCGKVIEFHEQLFDELEKKVAAQYGFRLEGHHHQLVGACPACQAREAGAG